MPLETEAHQAKAIGNDLRVSWKEVTEIGRFVDGDSVEKAKGKLEKVIEKELEVPFTKFKSGAGHKPGNNQEARYPVGSAEEVLRILENAENNAENEGLNNSQLEIQKFITNQGRELRTPKRHRGRSIKTAHIKIVVGEN